MRIANDHPTLAGRTGKIVDSDLAKHEFEIELHRVDDENLANEADTVSSTSTSDTADCGAGDIFIDADDSSAVDRARISTYDLAVPEVEVAGGRGKGRSNKNAKNNKPAAQSLRPAQCTFSIEQDEANNIQGFGIVVKASTLNELAGLKDSTLCMSAYSLVIMSHLKN